MTRTMYDSTEVRQIPRDATAVMGYIGPVARDNRFVTFPDLVHDFPHANKLSVAVHIEYDAELLDIEFQDATPDQFPGWYRRMKLKGEKRPGAYGSRDTIPTVIKLAASAGIPRDEYRILSAHFGIGEHICSPVTCGASFTADGTQWTDRALGRNLDESLLKDGFFPDAPKRTRRPPKPHPKVTAATLGAAIITAIQTVVHAKGLKITPAEASAIAAAAAGLSGYFFPAKRKRPK